jgi:hypothetical protein
MFLPQPKIGVAANQLIVAVSDFLGAPVSELI